MPSLQTIFLFALAPMLAATFGGILAVFRPPGAKVRSYIQHFAAGVVFSVVAVELLPDIIKRHLPWEVAIGFAAGVAVMLALKALTQKLETRKGSGSSSLLAGVAIDIFIDGLLIGVGFTAGAKEGMLLTVALSVELLSLGLAVSAALGKTAMKPNRIIAVVACLGFLIVLGSLLGGTLLHYVPPELMEVTLAFGLAALLFLVTEELLVEAHEEPETPAATAMFFCGFLLFFIIGMVS